MCDTYGSDLYLIRTCDYIYIIYYTFTFIADNMSKLAPGDFITRVVFVNDHPANNGNNSYYVIQPPR